MPRPEVVGNGVTATGIACPTYVSALEQIPEECAVVSGDSLAVALGIAACWYPCILIADNDVYADAHACVQTDATAINEFDPISVGTANSIGIGITTIGCFIPEIIGNTTTGEASATGYIGALELLPAETHGFGSSIGFGACVLVGMSWFGTVSGNDATGLGDAECCVLSQSMIPLRDADATSLANGMGWGIAVMCSPYTDVLRCNTAAGVGSARVHAEYIADFGWEYAQGFASSYDILMKLMYGPGFGVVNYNSMVDVAPLGITDGPILVMDAGLLKVGYYPLDATLNWWNHVTGPSGMGPGIVQPPDIVGNTVPEPVIWVGAPVTFSPWLYVDHHEVLDEQVGKFGFYLPMCKGLNTISTPIALEDDIVPSNTWADILDNSDLVGKVKPIQQWTGTGWTTVDYDAPVEPLEGFYIYMLEPGLNVILFVSSDDSMPMRDLTTGWNLIGPNPLFGEDFMYARHVLSSVENTFDALPGYSQVVSPIVWCQDAWAFVPDMMGPGPEMMSGRGYWVYMANPDTLVGFGFTPLPAGP
jgi:hypothetical protein